MKIITSHSQESAAQLCEGLNAAGVKCSVVDVNKSWTYEDYTGVVLSLGSSAVTQRAYARYNKSEAVLRCVDKVETFRRFVDAGVPTVAYCTQPWNVREEWEWVVCRESRSGRKAEGYRVLEKGSEIPDWSLFTEYFDHVREYRVMVWRGEAFVYFKSEANGWHTFKYVKKHKRIHDELAKDAIKAAKALRIDYAGFDVLVNAKGIYKFLEANSGATITDEVQAAIIEFFKKLKGA